MLDAFAPKAVILSGGPASVHEAESPAASKRIFDARRAGAGHLLRRDDHVRRIGRSGGGRPCPGVRPRRHPDRTRKPAAGGPRRHRRARARLDEPRRQDHRHPLGFEVVAASEGSPYAVIADEGRRFYGIQFHPEVAHTPRGALMLRNFTHGIAGLSGDWDHGLVPPEDGPEDPRPGRLRSGDLRPFRRRGLVGGRGADPRGDRRTAHLRLRRHRPPAPQRGRAGRDPVPRSLQHSAGTC